MNTLSMNLKFFDAREEGPPNSTRSGRSEGPPLDSSPFLNETSAKSGKSNKNVSSSASSLLARSRNARSRSRSPDFFSNVTRKNRRDMSQDRAEILEEIKTDYVILEV